MRASLPPGQAGQLSTAATAAALEVDTMKFSRPYNGGLSRSSRSWRVLNTRDDNLTTCWILCDQPGADHEAVWSNAAGGHSGPWARRRISVTGPSKAASAESAARLPSATAGA